MYRKKIIIFLITVCCFVLLCFLMFPKEEELYTKPVIEAYKNDDFSLVDVKIGDIVKNRNINLSVQNIDEKILSFTQNDFSYKGVYVKQGDRVKEGQLLAELSPEENEKYISDSSSLQITAPFDGVITYAIDISDNEKSVSNQAVVIINKSDRFILSTFTPHWKYFKPGESYDATILGKLHKIKVVDSSEIGINKFSDPTEDGASARVYFSISEDDLLLYSGIMATLNVTLDSKKDVLYIPSKAVNIVNGEKIVYMENKDGIRSIHSIETGLDNGHIVEITKGLSENDKVIVDN